MRHTTTFPVLLAAAALAAGTAGCNGPTSIGAQRRAESEQRIKTYSAAFVYDQATQELNAGRFDRALETINRAIDADPEAAEYMLLLGRIYFESDRLERALQAFTDTVAIKQSAVEAARATLAERVEAGTIEESTRLAAERELVSTDRVEAEARYFRGIVQQRLNRDEASLEDYRAAHALDPERVQYLVATAETLLTLGRADEVSAIVEPVMDRYEGDPSLLVVLGRAAMITGDPIAASARYGEAHLLAPDDRMVTEELAQARFAAGLWTDCLVTVAELSAGLAEPRTDLVRLEARCLANLGRPEEADLVYRQLVRLTPEDPSAWIEHASVAWSNGHGSRAAYCGAKLVGLVPDRWEGWFFRGVHAATAENGSSVDAETWLRAAAARSTDAALPHLALADFLASRGDVDGAAAARRVAASLEPGLDANDPVILGSDTVVLGGD